MLYTIPEMFSVPASEDHDINDIDQIFNPKYAVHYTIIFHATALMQIFNLINAKFIGNGKVITFSEFYNNYWFTFLIIMSYVC
jgi:hypothetical protein